MKKKIREVNGVKVIRRYSAGAFFMALFCLVLVAIPVALIFIPWFKITVTEGSDVTVISLTAVELISKVFLGQITGTGSEFMSFYAQLASDANQTYIPTIALGLAYGVPVLYGIVALFALFFLIFALELIFRGRMNHFKAPYVLSWFYFIFVALFGLIGIGLDYGTQFIYSLIGSSITYTIATLSWYNYIFVGASLLGIICLGITYSGAFRDKIFIGDISDMRHANYQVENPTINQNGANILVPQEPFKEDVIKKVQNVPAMGLPPTLKSIGGHAFSENLNLVVAVIPLGIKSLGRGAFANCGHLKVVSLPISIRSIGNNCFFNCANMERLNYAGNKEQWRHVKRGANWLAKAGVTTVICVDGPIVVNPYH